MNLLELLGTIAQEDSWKSSRTRNTKTALRYLAKGLGKKEPQDITESEYTRPIDDLIHILNSALNGKQGQTVKNYRNFIRYLFRRAEALNIITPLEPAKKRITFSEAYYTSNGQFNLDPSPYRLNQRDWPSNIRQWWKHAINDASYRLTQTTLQLYTNMLGRYIGFLTQSSQTPKTPEQLYDYDNLKSFVNWHAQRREVRGLTSTCTVWTCAMKLPEDISTDLKENVSKIQRSYNSVEAMHDKTRYIRELKLKEVESVGLALINHASEAIGDGNGITKAVQYRDGLMLRLLVRRPMRQRNLRQMRLGRNLYQDESGQWCIHFRGEELKVTTRNGHTNEYLATWPFDLIDDLQIYLSHYRPIITQETKIDIVFPKSASGGVKHPGQFNSQHLTKRLKARIYQYTGKHFTPHLIRSIYATEMAKNGVHVGDVAYMLNDEIATVWNAYYTQTGEGATIRSDNTVSSLIQRQAVNGDQTQPHGSDGQPQTQLSTPYNHTQDREEVS